jgi:hypothetical protein
MSEYISLLNDLVKIRELHNGLESNEEDNLLDKMDAIWLDLTDEERAKLQEP